MPVLPKGIYRFNTIPTKIPEEFLTKLEQIILKSVQEKKKERKKSESHSVTSSSLRPPGL